MGKKADQAAPAEKREPSFEQALGQLEEIVQQLEAGEKSLEESLQLYERGVVALRSCHAILDRAEQRIRKLVSGPDGQPVLEELRVPAAGSAEEARPGPGGPPGPAGVAQPPSAVFVGHSQPGPGAEVPHPRGSKPAPSSAGGVTRAPDAPPEKGAGGEAPKPPGGSLFGGA